MKRMSLFLFLLLSLAIALDGQAQRVGMKTNFLHWAVAGTPNLGLEVAPHARWSIDLSGGYNRWGDSQSQQKLWHWAVVPEARYWLCEAFNGHFFGVHAVVGGYNAGGNDLYGLLPRLKDHRYQGYGYGGGLTYGYAWTLTPRLNLEMSLGAGYVHLDYDKFPCVKCGSLLASETHHHWGITKATLSLVYLLR